MPATGHGKILFALGIVSIVVLLAISSLVSTINKGDNTKTLPDGKTEVVVPTSDIQTDPLVTVVPESIRGGRPQPLDTDPQRGALEPSVVVVEFGDFECDACAEMQPVMEQILAEYPDDVLHVWKDFPIPNQHPYSETAAQAARCAQNQGKFWEYHDLLLSQHGLFPTNPWTRFAENLDMDIDAFEQCLTTESTKQLILQSYFVARSLEVEGTPAYFINGQYLFGHRTIDELRQVIDGELQKGDSN